MVNALGIAAVAVTGVTALLAILATAIAQWSTATGANWGLWKTCSEFRGISNCVDISSSTEINLTSVRAMMILGILVLIASLVCGVIVLFVKKEMKILFFVAGGLDIAAGLFLMAGFAVYAGKLKFPGYDFGACFALDVVAWLLAWVGGALFVVCKIMNKD